MLLIFETITWKPHVETAMEIALTERQKGGQVRYYSLRAGLPACEDISPTHRLLDLPSIRTRRSGRVLTQHGIEHLAPQFAAGEREAGRTAAQALLAQCESLSDLKKVRYGDFTDIGWGAISSVVSLHRNATITLDSHRKELTDYVAASIMLFKRACTLIREQAPSRVLLFNGRFATTRAILRAAECCGVEWRIHERGGNKDRYWLLDYMPHQMERFQQDVLAAWDPAQAEEGHDFFTSRRNRVEKDWHSFVLGQERGRLPAPMQEHGDWVTFFTSAEDEMFAIGDEYSRIPFPDQMDAIHAVASAVAQVPGLRLCVRVHPHVAKKSRADRERWSDMYLPGALVLGPADPTDSYALIERSRVVCTYGSTVGVEATYWRRPSLLLAPSYYDRLGVCEVASSSSEVLEFLRSPVVFDRERTLPYGAFWSRLGTPYRHYRADNLHRGSICGVYLDDSPGVRLLQWISGPFERVSQWLR